MAGYSFNLLRGEGKVRNMILKDIGRFSDLGAYRHVSDLFEVLKQFDLAHPFDALEEQWLRVLPPRDEEIKL